MRAKLSSPVRWLSLAIVALGVACSSAEEPTGVLVPPSELQAEALGLSTVRVSWRPAAGGDISGYELQRRTDLHGAFVTIESSLADDGANRVAYFDTSVEPNRYYGYRVRALSRLGARSTMSNIAGAKTASAPGVIVQTQTSFANAVSADADGYLAVIRGERDTTSIAVAINGERLISPIARGTYSVALRGLATNCATTNLSDTVKSATVTDEGTRTVSTVTFNVSCRDPRKASIVVALQTAGDTVDADGVLATVSGIIREPGTPADERVYFQSRTILGASGAARYDDLRPGDYEVSLSDVESPCVLEGERKKTLQPKALAVDTVRFALTCRKPIAPVDTIGRPFVLRQTWSAANARPGDKVSLLTSLDLRAQVSQEVAGVSANIQFDNAVVRYDSARTTGAFDVTVVNRPQPTVVAFASTNTGGNGLGGNIQVVRTWYTIVGAVGSSVRTSTTVSEVLSPQLASLNSKVRVEDATLTVTSVGGTTNQPPTALVSGPATGTVGAAVAFSGAQSTDSDGTIASYAWSFGDAGTGTGAAVTHTYTSAATYTVRLTVTDDRGATATRDASIVVSAAGATTGTIVGTVTSPQQGALANVTATVAGGPLATTSATGAYSIANVATGARAVSLSGLPAGCTAPAAQTVTVTAGASVTANFTVTCTVSSTTGTVSGRLTRVSDGAGIGFARVVVQPAGGAALAPVTTGADGSYVVANVPVGTGGTAGTGSITLSDLPSGCTAPASQSYSGLSVGGTATKDIAVTCQVATTGTVTGTVTRNTGGALANVAMTVTPTGGAAMASVNTNASGSYTVTNVPAGGGTVTLGTLPAGCTNPGPQNYSGLIAGASVTKDLTVTCAAAAHTYPLTATWGAITNTGPTGRQVTLSFSIDMGSAPGRPDIAGAAADPLAGISFSLTAYNGTMLDQTGRTLLSPDEFDLAAVSENGQGTASAQVNAAVGSTSGLTKTGAFPIIRFLFNIAAGATGSITPTATVTEALATTSLIVVTSSVVIQPLPTLTIP